MISLQTAYTVIYHAPCGTSYCQATASYPGTTTSLDMPTEASHSRISAKVSALAVVGPVLHDPTPTVSAGRYGSTCVHGTQYVTYEYVRTSSVYSYEAFCLHHQRKCKQSLNVRN